MFILFGHGKLLGVSVCPSYWEGFLMYTWHMFKSLNLTECAYLQTICVCFQKLDPPTRCSFWCPFKPAPKGHPKTDPAGKGSQQFGQSTAQNRKVLGRAALPGFGGGSPSGESGGWGRMGLDGARCFFLLLFLRSQQSKKLTQSADHAFSRPIQVPMSGYPGQALICLEANCQEPRQDNRMQKR